LDDEGIEKDSLGVLVRVYPQRIAGNAPVFRQEHDHFDLTYTANDSTAPTLVFVPPRLKAARAEFNGHAVPIDTGTHLVSVRNEGGAGSKQQLYIEWE
jgi:hypothetical protein